MTRSRFLLTICAWPASCHAPELAADTLSRQQSFRLRPPVRDVALSSHPAGVEVKEQREAVETAYRMQTVAPEVCDITRAPKHILEVYGCTPDQMSCANNCLLARRQTVGET